MNYTIIGVLLFILGSISICTVKCDIGYKREVEDGMITGMTDLSNVFREFEKSVQEYKLQANHSTYNISHSIDSSCFTHRSLTFLKELNELFVKSAVIPQIKIKIEKVSNNVELCIQQKKKHFEFKDVTELCLRKVSVRSILANSKARKILGHTGQANGDFINCSLSLTTKPKETTGEQNIGGRVDLHKYEKQSTFPSGGWFACGVALGLFVATTVFVFVWLNKARTEREINSVRSEASKDRNAKEESAYKDIDEYELIPFYRDPTLNNRFTKPPFATHLPEKLEIRTERNGPVVSGLDRRTDTTENKQFDGYSHLALERDPNYHILEKQDSTIKEKTIEKNQPYFVLENIGVGDTDNDIANEPANETEGHFEKKGNIDQESVLVQHETKETIETTYM